MVQLSDPQKKWVDKFLSIVGEGTTAQSPAPTQTHVPAKSPDPAKAPAGEEDLQASCLIKVTNSTNVVLTLLDQGHDRGDFKKFPDTPLQPGASTDFVSVETPNSKDDGCKGFVVWQVGAPGDCTWRIEWDNPEQAKNTSTSNLSGAGAKNYRELDQIGDGDENVPVHYTISGVGVPAGAPPTGTAPATATATLEVLVLGLHKLPRADATVKISKGPSTVPDAVTDANGVARIELLPGDYEVTAARTIATWEPVHVKQASLLPGKAFKITLDKLHHGKLIVTVKRDGKPEVDAMVMILTDKHDPKHTGSDGQTDFTLLAGPHQATAVSADGVWGGSTQAKVVAGDFVEAEIQLKAAAAGKPASTTGKVTVVLTDLQTSAAVEFAKVTVANVKPTSVEKGTGKYLFENVPAGKQQVFVSEEDYHPHNGSVTVKAGETVTYDAYMEREKRRPDPAPAGKTGRVTIVVADLATEAPIGDATVTVAGISPTSINAATGGYVFAAVPLGDQDVAATAPNYKPYNGTARVRDDDAGQYSAFMQPKSPAPAPPPTPARPPAPTGKTGRVTIVVKDLDSEAPIGDAVVTVAGISPTSINAATGGYVFAAVPLDSQDVAATAPNYNSYNGTARIRSDVATQYNAFMQPKKPAPAHSVDHSK